MPISFSGTTTYQHVQQAIQLYAKAIPNPLANTIWICVISIITLLGVGIIISPTRAISVLVFLVVFFVLIVATLMATESSNKESWSNNTGSQDPQTGTVTEMGIEIRTSTYVVQMQWIYYRYYLISSDLVVLYCSPYSYGIYAKSFFATSEDWQAFVEQVQLRIPSTPLIIWKPSTTKTRVAWMTFLLISVTTIGIAVIFSL